MRERRRSCNVVKCDGDGIHTLCDEHYRKFTGRAPEVGDDAREDDEVVRTICEAIKFAVDGAISDRQIHARAILCAADLRRLRMKGEPGERER